LGPLGPLVFGVQVLLERGEPPSDVEAVILLACFDLWNGTGKLEFGELVTTLDGPRLHLLGSLMMALGQGVDTVDHWIDEHSEAALVLLSTSTAKRRWCLCERQSGPR
jgi:hypothetical protein